jgi:hypothetical protein
LHTLVINLALQYSADSSYGLVLLTLVKVSSSCHGLVFLSWPFEYSQGHQCLCAVLLSIFVIIVGHLHCEPGSSVSIVSGYGLDDRAIEVRFPADARGFFL